MQQQCKEIKNLKKDFDSLYRALYRISNRECTFVNESTREHYNVIEDEMKELKKDFTTLHVLILNYVQDENLCQKDTTELRQKLLQSISKNLSLIVSRFSKSHCPTLDYSNQVISVHTIASHYATELKKICNSYCHHLTSFEQKNYATVTQ